MKKITLYLLVSTMILFLCACGNTRKMKSNDTESIVEKNTKITILSIQIASGAKAMYAKVFIPSGEVSKGSNYWLDGLDVYNTKLKDVDGGIEISMCGFYSYDTTWKKPKLYRGFQSPDSSNTPLDHIEIIDEVEKMEERKIEAYVDGSQKTISVEITPYTVSICPTKKWTEDGCYYNIIATTKENKQYSMGYLPLTDDRKASVKTENPLNDTTELEELGGGFASLVEMDNSGVRYAFNKKIDINQIEKIELKIL